MLSEYIPSTVYIYIYRPVHVIVTPWIDASINLCWYIVLKHRMNRSVVTCMIGIDRSIDNGKALQ